MVILAHVIAVLQWVSSWLQVGSASLSLSVLLTAIFVGEGKTVPPSTSTTHIRDNSVMSNNINILNRVNHLGNVSILTSATFPAFPSHRLWRNPGCRFWDEWMLSRQIVAISWLSWLSSQLKLILPPAGPDGRLPSHLSGGRQSESGHHPPVISQPGQEWGWLPPRYLVRFCDIQLLFRPSSVRSSWCKICKNCLQWKIGE